LKRPLTEPSICLLASQAALSPQAGRGSLQLAIARYHRASYTTTLSAGQRTR
jgi:hypothetical protein